MSKTTLNSIIRQATAPEGAILKSPRRPPKVDLTGKLFGDLKVIEMLHPIGQHGHYRCNCKCRCGNHIIVEARSLCKRVNPTCGCETWERKKGKDNPRYKGYQDISGYFWLFVQRNAKQRGIPFNITIQQAWDLYAQQNKRCALSGVDIHFGLTAKDENTASIDRKNPHLGYTLDNIQWVHKSINFSKHTMTNEEFVNMCKRVCEHEVINKNSV